MNKLAPLFTAGTLSLAAIALAVNPSSVQGNPSVKTPVIARGGGAPITQAAQAPTTPVRAPVNTGTPITLTAGGVVIKATLNTTKVAQDFAAMLPVTLPWFRNFGIEYITELSTPLTEIGPFYTDVQPGDLVYYNPLDSITIIYEETSSVPTLTKMGQVTSDLSVFGDLPDNVDMRIELDSTR